MEQCPGQFVGNMISEAYTVLVEHILQKTGIYWSHCMKANLVPWNVPPKGKVPIGEARYGFQFIDRLIRDYQPRLIISFGADIVNFLLPHKKDATVTDLQGQLLELPQYGGTQLICTTQPVNLISKVQWIPSWERTLRAGITSWFNQTKKVKIEPPEYRITTLAELRKHLQAIVDNKEDIIALDTEFVGNDITDYRILDIILASSSRTLNIGIHEGRSKPVLSNPYNIEPDKGEVYIFPSKEAFDKWTPSTKAFRAYIDDVHWIFDRPQEE
jgi:hypothetical protein